MKKAKLDQVEKKLRDKINDFTTEDTKKKPCEVFRRVNWINWIQLTKSNSR